MNSFISGYLPSMSIGTNCARDSPPLSPTAHAPLSDLDACAHANQFFAFDMHPRALSFTVFFFSML